MAHTSSFSDIGPAAAASGPAARLPVGLLGATGMVGQQFVAALAHHPWFDLVWLGASRRSAGRPYGEAAHWLGEGEIPESVAEIEVSEALPGSDCPTLVFSAMDPKVAGEIERNFAQAGRFVVSNSSNHRMEPDVPLLIPEINPDHLKLIPGQRRVRDWTGAIITNPNCSTIGLALALAPLRPFGIESLVVTTMQALSGAGHPGVPSLDIIGNIVPKIGSEEEKIGTETLKILGEFGSDEIQPLRAAVSAHCNRVPVVDGHMLCVSVKLTSTPSPDEVCDALCGFRGLPQELGLPSAPAHPVRVTDAAARPQPRLDSWAGDGMAVSIGRVRRCPVLTTSFVALVHNTVRGAAGASVLNAELLRAERWLDA
ncbi:MAG: aspartate-semialdehyde dehydrogenase [Gemmatimonadetes bacterium]|nr:aspartate-semialdehyde dehydrogenase [Gemmatimonadota bacterium]